MHYIVFITAKEWRAQDDILRHSQFCPSLGYSPIPVLRAGDCEPETIADILLYCPSMTEVFCLNVDLNMQTDRVSRLAVLNNNRLHKIDDSSCDTIEVIPKLPHGYIKNLAPMSWVLEAGYYSDRNHSSGIYFTPWQHSILTDACKFLKSNDWLIRNLMDNGVFQVINQYNYDVSSGLLSEITYRQRKEELIAALKRINEGRVQSA